jgi:hypothetical protein
VLQKAAGTLLFLTFVLQLLLAMSMSIDYELQTTQELGASPNVMSYLEGSNEVQMGPLHMALQNKRQACVSALLEHKLVRNLASEIHKNRRNIERNILRMHYCAVVMADALYIPRPSPFFTH